MNRLVKIIKNFSGVSMVVLCIVLFTSDLHAQNRLPYYKGWKAQFYLGSTNFKGDLKNSHNGFIDNSPLSKFFYQDRKLGGVVRIEKKFNHLFGLSGQMLFARVAGTSDMELMSFKANVFEYSMMAHFYVSDAIMGYDRFRKWHGYAFIGLGLTESRSWLYSTTSGTAVDSNGYHSDRGVFFINRPMTEAVIPVGLGFSYEIYDNFNLVLEYSFHAINTDKLDVWISNNAKLEGFGFFSLGMNVSFQTPKNWSFRRGLPRYNGKSSDPAIRAYNKRKRVVMTSKRQQRYASKKRYSHKRKRIKRRRKLNLSR